MLEVPIFVKGESGVSNCTTEEKPSGSSEVKAKHMLDSPVALPVSVPHVKNELLITSAKGSHCLSTPR